MTVPAAMTSARKSSRRTGVGLRLPHLAEVVADRPLIPWFEIHPENFLANPHAAELLGEVARHYPISLHTVGVSVGSASGIDRAHLKRVRALADRVDPFLISGHLAWSTHEGTYFNDLLPLPYNKESLAVLAAHISEVQDEFGCQFLIENPSSYVGFAHSTMTEVEFLNELVARTGCGLLCDVSNIYLSAHNMGFDADRYVDELPVDSIGEFHLGGYSAEDDDAELGGTVLICGVVCRLGAAFGPSLLQSFSAHVAGIFRELPFPCELTEHLHLHDDPFTDFPCKNGTVTIPDAAPTSPAPRWLQALRCFNSRGPLALQFDSAR